MAVALSLLFLVPSVVAYFVSSLSFSAPLLAGTASWETLLRAGRHCGLLLPACGRVAFMVLPKINTPRCDLKHRLAATGSIDWPRWVGKSCE
jgi:hypothetical protein